MLRRAIRPAFSEPNVWLCRQCKNINSPGRIPRVNSRNISYNGEGRPSDSAGHIRNPMDYVNNPKADKEYKAQIYRRMKWASLGLAVCLVAQFAIISAMPSQEELEARAKAKNASMGAGSAPSILSNARTDAREGLAGEFQGKPVHVVGGGAKLVAHDEKTGEDLEVVPTGTSTIPHFPKTIHVPSSDAANAEDVEYQLVGLGIRTVSFLSIQVYVVGMYVQTSSLSPLQASLVKRINPTASALIPDEKAKLKDSLLEADASYELWDELLKDTQGQVKSAFRIVPTRNTDFQHLKDGWVRGITAKTQSANAKGDAQFQDDSFGLAMREFKGLFTGGGKAPKGSTVLLTRDGSGALSIYYQQKEDEGKLEKVGFINDERIARLIWLGYLGGKSVSSEPARKNVVDGIMDLVERPIGSVETMVV